MEHTEFCSALRDWGGQKAQYILSLSSSELERVGTTQHQLVRSQDRPWETPMSKGGSATGQEEKPESKMCEIQAAVDCPRTSTNV